MFALLLLHIFFFILCKSLCCLKFSSKMSIFSGYVYVQLFCFNSNDKNLFITINVTLLNLHIEADLKNAHF